MSKVPKRQSDPKIIKKPTLAKRTLRKETRDESDLDLENVVDKSNKQVKVKTSTIKASKTHLPTKTTPAKGLETNDESDLDLENEVDQEIALQELQEQTLKTGVREDDEVLRSVVLLISG